MIFSLPANPIWALLLLQFIVPRRPNIYYLGLIITAFCGPVVIEVKSIIHFSFGFGYGVIVIFILKVVNETKGKLEKKYTPSNINKF